jgi:hypothetical protein
VTGSLLARLSAVVSFMNGWLNGKKMRCEDDVVGGTENSAKGTGGGRAKRLRVVTCLWLELTEWLRA